MRKVILLSGKQGTGKTSLQKALVKEFEKSGTPSHVVNFADAIYDMHNYCIEYLKECGIERDIVKDGPLLQLLGTDWGRKTISEDIWVNVLKNQVETDPRAKVVFIVGDCRFQNELKAFPHAYKVRLECPREIRKARCSMWRDNENHPSEVDLDGSLKLFDCIFHTDKMSTEEIANDIMKGIGL